MRNYTQQYPNLRELLYFLNQDWKLMFEWEDKSPTYEGAIRKLKVDDTVETRRKTIYELKELVSSNFDEQKLEEIVNDDFGSAFYPPGLGMTYQQWLINILQIMEEPIEETKKYVLPKFVGEN